MGRSIASVDLGFDGLILSVIDQHLVDSCLVFFVFCNGHKFIIILAARSINSLKFWPFVLSGRRSQLSASPNHYFLLFLDLLLHDGVLLLDVSVHNPQLLFDRSWFFIFCRTCFVTSSKLSILLLSSEFLLSRFSMISWRSGKIRCRSSWSDQCL